VEQGHHGKDQPSHQRKCFCSMANQLNRGRTLFGVATRSSSFVAIKYANRRRAKWRWISVGSIFAALAWLAVSSLFSWYLGNFANYNATYGALGAVVGLWV
jgi:YihY family inner membrane protein